VRHAGDTDAIRALREASMTRPYEPAWWLPGPHTQTLWAAIARRVALPALAWQEIQLPDGDHLDLAWVGAPGAARGTAIVLHGLAGSVRSPHVGGLCAALVSRGWRVGALHLRGCGRGPNRSAVGYHAGKSDDVRHALRAIGQAHPGPIVAVGFSLGANLLIKLLGEDGEAAPVAAAAAISAPFRLDLCSDRMERGFSQVYQAALTWELRRYVQAKVRAGAPIDPGRLRGVWSFRAFDNAITAPLHGFVDSADYYARASAAPFLPRVRVPLLVLHALDDPFFTPAVLPGPSDVPRSVTLEVVDRGGHVGFVEGRAPLRGRYYVDRRVPDWLAGVTGAWAPRSARRG